MKADSAFPAAQVQAIRVRKAIHKHLQNSIKGNDQALGTLNYRGHKLQLPETHCGSLH